jgi:stage V sporulation protein G
VEITEVRVKLMDEPGERLQAFCSITFDDAFVVRDLKIIEGTTGPFVAMPSRKIIEGTTGPFVAMPSRKLTAHCFQCGTKNHLRAAFCNQCGTRMKELPGMKDDDGRAKLYADIAHPINSQCREMIQQRVIKAFEEERARAKMPGYVSSYEDFEPEFIAPPAQSRSTATVATHTQGPERPRGPHKPPHHAQPQTTADRQNREGFGAGVFD